MAEFRARSWN